MDDNRKCVSVVCAITVAGLLVITLALTNNLDPLQPSPSSTDTTTAAPALVFSTTPIAVSRVTKLPVVTTR